MNNITIYAIAGGVVLSLVLGLGFQTYRLKSAQESVKSLQARTSALEASRDNLRGMYTQAVENLTTELTQAHRRIDRLNTALNSSPEAKSWGESSIPDEVLEVLNE